MGETLITMRKRFSVALTALLALVIVACNPAKKYEEEEKALSKTMLQIIILPLHQMQTASIIWKNIPAPVS